MEVYKYEGLGNDLAFFEGSPESLLDGVDDRIRWITRICDRHLGIGADGVMFVDPGSAGEQIATIHYFNADGSPAEMCGNGLRCAGLFLHHQGHAPVGPTFTVDMVGAGTKRCRLIEASGETGTLEVEIGSPVRGEGAEGRPDRLRLGVHDREVSLVPLSVGNPHAVTFDDVTRTEMEALGPSIENNHMFPDRVNVEFAKVTGPNILDLVVWERGCGFTQACGSGACAAATAAIWEERCEADTFIAINLPGGTLHVRLDSAQDLLWLKGPARRVFTASAPRDNF